MAVTLRKFLQQLGMELQFSGRVQRIHAILFIDRLAQHDSPSPVAPLEEIIKRPVQVTSHHTSCTLARCEMVILVCEIARHPASSIEFPPRKCKMLTPRSKPSRLTRMKSSAGPWNQVAIMYPSLCQTVRNRSQSAASRQTTQFSTTSRIANFSSVCSSMSCHLPFVSDIAAHYPFSCRPK